MRILLVRSFRGDPRLHRGRGISDGTVGSNGPADYAAVITRDEHKFAVLADRDKGGIWAQRWNLVQERELSRLVVDLKQLIAPFFCP